MTETKIIDGGQEGICPKCHNRMSIVSPQYYDCSHCQQHYQEQHICPICRQNVQMVKGCGAINYICHTDGLISSSKVIFHYLPE
ncbi:zinc-ribbon domain-containing protein [Gilliamella sp. A7]|uniref:YfgJ family double zinc ribbon protein n=1 Tax=Gilliamella sp. A7 TaxID=1970465 RepID=UPI000A35717C|nr:zinc-ribbon domain-containing protein [Gilliamella sp. A7]OTQ60379.1 hypothetical protein B6D18_00200 [Gilliamella sp. A7]